MKSRRLFIGAAALACAALVLALLCRQNGSGNASAGVDGCFKICRDGLSVELCCPSENDGYYRGCRFDWAGVFRRIAKDGNVYADEWYDAADPYRHDNVCGPSEEFVSPVSEEAGPFVKIGVGRLMKDEGPYDRFRLYPIIDAGVRGLEINDASAVFTHVLEGEYEYEKRIVLPDGETMKIEHVLKNCSSDTLKTKSYNHNFFTLGDMRVGPSVRLDFSGRLEGQGFENFSNVRLEGNSIVFDKVLEEGKDFPYIDELFADSVPPSSYRISNLEKNIAVEVKVNSPIAFCVFWSCHSTSCVEPYITITLAPGESCSWSIDYKFI